MVHICFQERNVSRSTVNKFIKQDEVTFYVYVYVYVYVLNQMKGPKFDLSSSITAIRAHDRVCRVTILTMKYAK